MASKFGAKIVPFGVVGEDDVGEVSLTHLLHHLHNFLRLVPTIACYFGEYETFDLV